MQITKSTVISKIIIASAPVLLILLGFNSAFASSWQIGIPPSAPEGNSDVDLLIFKGEVFASKEMWIRASYYFDKALEIDPNNSDAKNERSKALGKIHQKEREIEQYEDWIQKDPNSTEVPGWILRQAQILFELRKFDEAEAYCDRGIQMTKDKGVEISGIMMCKMPILIEQGRYDEIPKYDKIFREKLHEVDMQQPDRTEPLGEQRVLLMAQPLYMPVYLYQTGRYNELIEWFDEWVQISGRPGYDFYSLVLKGVIYEKMNNKEQADYYYQNIANQLGIQPDGLNYMKGILYMQLKDYDKAIYYLERAPKDNQEVAYAKVIVYDELEKASPTSQIQKIVENAKGGGCLIATAAFGSELAPQVQRLRETRDNVLLQTQSGAAFMTAFNQFYYSFAPTIADWERENPFLREIVKAAITPLITTLSILNYVDIDSESEMVGYGIGVILLNIGMYFMAPAFVIMRLKKSCVINQ